MFVVERGHAGDERADEANRIVAPADAGFEHREFALPFLKIQTGQREQGFECAELFAAPRRDPGDISFDPRCQPRQAVIANGLAWPLTGRLASLLGATKIANRGGQNHQFTRDEIRQRFNLPPLAG